MKRKLIAFEDTELNDWLMDLIADGSGSFLSTLAEAVVTADAEDYSIIRPRLIELKRKHSGRHPKRVLEPDCYWLEGSRADTRNVGNQRQ
jgi:hypothetical protein